MVGPLQAAVDAGIKVITVDTFLGDGDYVNGPVKFPISYIGSDNVEGGRISARGLAEAIGGKGTVYINSTNPNVSSVQGREQGFKEVMGRSFRHQGSRPTTIATIRTRSAADRRRAGARTGAGRGSGTNVSAPGRGTAVVNAGLGGQVQVVAYDATQFAIELWARTSSASCWQKPFDMGYMAVQFAAADAAG